jgi:hypothetical protein
MLELLWDLRWVPIVLVVADIVLWVLRTGR